VLCLHLEDYQFGFQTFKFNKNINKCVYAIGFAVQVAL
jgi:hypothetical protein